MHTYQGRYLARFLVIHRCRDTIVPSLAVELPSRSCRPSPSRRGLHHPLFAISPSIAAHQRCALGPSPPRLRRPSPSRSHHAVPPLQGAVAPLASRSRQGAVGCRRPCRPTTPATRHAPPRPLVRMAVVLPLLTPPPSICRCLSLRHRLSCLSSVRLVVVSPRFSRHHLPSAGASASHRAIASCHAYIRSTNQDDTDGTSSIILPCPSS
jgi:hypothetical protein